MRKGSAAVHKVVEFWRDETAAATAETALMVAMLALATFAAWHHLSDTVENQAYESSRLLRDADN